METVACPVCGTDSAEYLRNRPDFEYDVKIRLTYYRCNDIHCGLVFADAIPVHQISSFYSAYSTHDQQAPEDATILKRRARALFMRETMDAIGSNSAAMILDYGCGNGQFLNELHDAGFTNLAGYDFDQKARETARSLGAHVVDREDDLASLGPFDVIMLNHVIEHLVDPASDLVRLSRLLSPGGRIVIRTPNARSALSRMLGDGWRGWETPRHLHIFSPASMRKLMQLPEMLHLTVAKIATSNAMFFGIFHESLHHGVWRSFGGKIARHVFAFGFYAMFSLINRLRGSTGEELVVVLRN